MSAFDLVPREAAAKMERRSSVDMNDGPGFFDGSLTAPALGAAKGLVVEPARVLNAALSHIPGALDQAFGTSMRDWWFENMMLERASRAVTPSPREVDTAGQILHALFDVGGQALTVGPAGVGMLKTVGKSIEGAEEGLDTVTALKKGAIEGLSAGLGVAMPIAITPVVGAKIPALVQQLAYGVGSNVGMGIASRKLTHEVLAAGGYNEMAEQYKALDEGGLMTDVVLGAAFGALGHAMHQGGKLPYIRPADVDAALARRNAYHIEVDTAPGLARNGETRDAHVESVLKATEDLIAGRPVDVAETLRAADFEENKPLDQVRERLASETEKVAKAYDEVLREPRGAADDPLVRMTPDDIGEILLERGPVLPPKGEIEVRPGGFGLVKVIWKHGERSKSKPEFQVTRKDVLRLPTIMQDFKPIQDEQGAKGERLLEWQVERPDGKKVVYSTRKFTETDKRQHVVTIMVNEERNAAMKAKPLSEKKGPSAESPGGASTAAAGDTAPGASSIATSPKGQADAATVARIKDALNREGVEPSDENVATVDLIARAREKDAAAVDALPDTLTDAEFMSKIKEIAGDDKTTEAAGQAGKGAAGERPTAGAGAARRDQGPGGEAARGPGGEAGARGEDARIVDAELRGAEAIVGENPDMLVTLETGEVVPAHQALAKADEVIAQAENDAKGFEAAVLCATRRGG